MSRKMEGFKRAGGEKEREEQGETKRERERRSAGFPGTDVDTPAREAVMRY